MTDSNITSEQPVSTPRPKSVRPARREELTRLHGWLMDAVETSPYYGTQFKAYEKRRLSLQYVHRLYEANPAHVMAVVKADVPVGVMASSPELGTLWLQWSYVIPEQRRGTLALSSLHHFIEYWDNGRFHKISTYTKTGNDVALALLTRYQFVQTCVLEQQIFGEDYLLFERKLNKAEEGYDQGISYLGTLGRLKQRVLMALGVVPQV